MTGGFGSELSLVGLQQKYGGELITNWRGTGLVALKVANGFKVSQLSTIVYVHAGYYLVEG